jgi:uncharacterized membrane protein
MSLRKVAGVGLRISLLLYPFYVWWAVNHLHPAAAVLPAVLVALFKSCSRDSSNATRGFFLLTCVALALALLSGQAEQAMLYYPLWMNAGMLLVFSASLWFPPTIVERFARMMEGTLDEHAVAYTRKVTQVWCGFFLFNGSIAALTAWWGDWDLWLLYNGGIAYGLMGLLMLIEWQVRRLVKAAK